MKTYQDTRGRRWHLIQEGYASLYRTVHRDTRAYAKEIVKRRDLAFSRIRETFGTVWEGCELLEIGCGQRCPSSFAFGAKNSVTAIDLDVVPRLRHPLTYAELLRTNGFYRCVKTIMRQALGVDRRERRALADMLGGSVNWPRVYRMDAQALAFDDAIFDGAFSFATFEHIPDVRCAMQELRRVVKPGGTIYIVPELFTCVTGCHDPRLWTNVRSLPLWSHLRPAYTDLVRPNVYINRLQMGDYQSLAREVFGNVRFYFEEHGTRQFLDELTANERAELVDYSDCELCTQDLVILGQVA